MIRTAALALVAAVIAGPIALLAAAGVGVALGVVRNWDALHAIQMGSMVGAGQGLVAALVVVPLRATPRRAVLASGAAFLALLEVWIVGVGRLPLHHWREALGFGAMYAVMGALAGGMVLLVYGWLDAGLRPAAPRSAVPRWLAVALGFAVACGLGVTVASTHRLRSAPVQACRRFATAFVAGSPAILGMLPYDKPGDPRVEEARLWWERLRPWLPRGGTIRVERRRYPGQYNAWCDCRVTVTGASYRPDPPPLTLHPTFRVSLVRQPEGWRVTMLDMPVGTYLASLYGPGAGRSWREWLLEHSATR